ncbi:MAG: hypothetical protein IJU71_07780, partial [Selenomonadaceae bacterium]|nr:hypothetical protein [Selenomonadaceae bacterium]
APAFFVADGGGRGRKNLSQESYQIVVKDSKGKTVWDSGRRKDGRSIDFAYAGSKLAAGETYNWTVTVWDNNGVKKQESSTFAVGLNPDRMGQDGWSGAKWIGSDLQTLPLDAQSLTVFRIACDIQIAQGSKSIGRATCPRTAWTNSSGRSPSLPM